MKHSRHWEDCDAPLCADADNGNAVWYAGEKVCKKVPWEKFQKKQLDINEWVKKGKFKNMNTPYTRHELETKSI